MNGLKSVNALKPATLFSLTTRQPSIDMDSAAQRSCITQRIAALMVLWHFSLVPQCDGPDDSRMDALTAAVTPR